MAVEPVFCKKCHKYVNAVRRDKTGNQLLGDGGFMGAKFSGIKYRDDKGRITEGWPVFCPDGHQLPIKDTKEQKQEQSRLRYRFGTLCPYHYRCNTKCDQKKPCKDCQAYKDREKFPDDQILNRM